MAAIRLLKSDRLVLVNCTTTDTMLKAGWGYTNGLLKPVETLDNGVSISIPAFMQSDSQGGELFIQDDTIDFYLYEH